VADNRAVLLPFAEKVPTFESEITKIQRKMQRSQRSNNPDNYHPDFERRVGNKVVKKKGKVTKGVKKWKNSKRYLKLASKKRELERRKSAYAKSQNRKLVNEILRHGSEIKTENVSVKAWQKRYGKAIAAKSPSFFQSELKRKAESAGGSFVKFSTADPAGIKFQPECGGAFRTQKTALSQTHLDGTRIKKSLAQRVHKDVSGFEMHRDLFSAFLSRYVYSDLLSVQEARESYPGLEPILQEAWKDFKGQQTASRVGESESEKSYISSEQFSCNKLTPDQIAELFCEGEKSGGEA